LNPSSITRGELTVLVITPNVDLADLADSGYYPPQMR